MSLYATANQIRAFAQQPDALAGGEGGDNWTLLATAASRLFDKLTEVPDDFYAVTSGSFVNRDFIGDGTAYLKLDPYTALNDTDPVLINDNTIDDPEFTSENVPDYVNRDGMLVVLSKTNQGGNSRVMADNFRFTGWPDGGQIRVSAKWGFAAIPQDITFAVIQIALQMFRTSDPAFAIVSGTDKAIGPTYPKFVTDTVEQYKGQYSRVFVFA